MVGRDMTLWPDIRIVYSRRFGHALQRGRVLIWLPLAVCRTLIERGPDCLGPALYALLETHGFVCTNTAPLANRRTECFLDHICNRSSQHLYNVLRETVSIVIGCGGLGSHVAMMLASLGAGRLHLVDNDVLDESNLNRLIWARRDDIGRRKVQVLKEFLTARYDCEITVTTENVGTECQALADLHRRFGGALFLTLDSNRAVRQIVSQLHRLGSFPYIHAGYNGCDCVVGPLVRTFDDACPFCHSERLDILNADAFIAPSALPNNALTAAFAVSQMLRVLGGKDSSVCNGVWRLDLSTGSIHISTRTKDDECATCQSR